MFEVMSTTSATPDSHPDLAREGGRARVTLRDVSFRPTAAPTEGGRLSRTCPSTSRRVTLRGYRRRSGSGKSTLLTLRMYDVTSVERGGRTAYRRRGPADGVRRLTGITAVVPRAPCCSSLHTLAVLVACRQHHGLVGTCDPAVLNLIFMTLRGYARRV